MVKARQSRRKTLDLWAADDEHRQRNKRRAAVPGVDVPANTVGANSRGKVTCRECRSSITGLDRALSVRCTRCRQFVCRSCVEAHAKSHPEIISAREEAQRTLLPGERATRERTVHQRGKKTGPSEDVRLDRVGYLAAAVGEDERQ
jgi:hypothetical protein